MIENMAFFPRLILLLGKAYLMSKILMALSSHYFRNSGYLKNDRATIPIEKGNSNSAQLLV